MVVNVGEQGFPGSMLSPPSAAMNDDGYGNLRASSGALRAASSGLRVPSSAMMGADIRRDSTVSLPEQAAHMRGDPAGMHANPRGACSPPHLLRLRSQTSSIMLNPCLLFSTAFTANALACTDERRSKHRWRCEWLAAV